VQVALSVGEPVGRSVGRSVRRFVAVLVGCTREVSVCHGWLNCMLQQLFINALRFRVPIFPFFHAVAMIHLPNVAAGAR